MFLEKLFPRPLSPHCGAESATLLGSLLSAVHLDRRGARALGWRGVRPSGTLSPAWTCRVAGNGSVFGLVFTGESSDAKTLCGEFAVFAFPDPEDSLLDRFPLEAMRLALHTSYAEKIRSLSSAAEELAPFELGVIRLKIALDGTGMTFDCRAQARQRMTSLDGVAAFSEGRREGWLVKPGGLEADIPAFCLLSRLFSALIASAEAVFGENARLSLSVSHCPSLAFTGSGSVVPLSGTGGRLIRLAAALGSAPDNGGRRIPRLPFRHKPRPEESGDRPVLHILTGFLGSGKTTFLRRWLDFLHGRERYTGVIQNEFGEIGLDAALMRDDTRVEALDEGCVCCSLADSLRPGLLRLAADMPAAQFILETTGLANPANILEALSELDDIVLPGLVVTVVDALALCSGETKTKLPGGLRLAQIERADVLVVNKADAVPPDALAELMDRLRSRNRQALVLPAYHGSIPFAELDAFYSSRLDRRGARLPSQRPTLSRRSEATTHAEEGYTSLTVAFTAPVTEEEIRALIADAGPGLCRAKGLADIRGKGPSVVQYAAGQLYFEQAGNEPDEPDTPGNVAKRYLVLIGVGLRRPGRQDDKGAADGTH